ncbi:hypothetical protein HYN59_11815 [Flavobacterium album]|uniref:Uncharacterized protein n=1 Tax=Flavobacterium album TaxID=2175091 RepID=A0A2S1QZC4_9FLAO|nr:hypothetical protein [Flavobacterium album]AWH85752.1 hypothetical protein HYN59_11815 [Flavobacterium album]
MKIIYFLLIVFLTGSNYDAIIGGLSKNYIFLYDTMGSIDYFEAFNTNEKKYQEDKKMYQQSVKDFFDADKTIIDFLLKYETDTLYYSQWIRTRNPYSSNLKKYDLMTNSDNALALIDNYLTQKDSIIITPHFEKISYSRFKFFYAKKKI